MAMDKFDEDRVKVPFGTKHLDAAISVPASTTGVQYDTAVILTHGAGGDMNFKHLVSLAHALASNGFICLRFTCKGLNLVYRVKAYRTVWDYLKSLEKFTIRHIFLGGRSMGSRAAAALARQLSDETEDAVQGVICLSFPLHPPGQTHQHQQRSEDLRGLPEHMPVLFVSGTEDNMCDRVLFEGVVKEMKAQVDVFCLKGGNHGLTVKGTSEDSVLDEVNSQVITWIINSTWRRCTSDVYVYSIVIGCWTSGCFLRGGGSSMAGEPWNRVNIPFPSAVSCVRIHFSRTTDVNVKSLLRENDNVRTLLSSKILQTEIRLLYELLYVLNNSYRGNKAFRALKQVEQCINRLKEMKLDVALQDLTDLCPTRMQRGVSVEVGECDVPSQPRLEWLCLKVLGAAQLMSRTLTCCSKAFILSKVQMKHEFLVLSVVITSMLCRLWVFFRGILDNLALLYRWLLEFLREVSQAKPMPFLTEFPLPADMAQFLGPSDTFLLTKTPSRDPVAKNHQEKQQKKKAAVKFTNKTRKEKEDLGVAVHRGAFHCPVFCMKLVEQG
ncbi:uncharacterized protein tex30 [Diretmus argenteus]